VHASNSCARNRATVRCQAAANDGNLVVDDHLLGNALGDVGNAGVVSDDQLHLPSGDNVAVLRNIEPRARDGLPAHRSEHSRQRHWEANLDNLLGERGQCREHAEYKDKTDHQLPKLFHWHPPVHDLARPLQAGWVAASISLSDEATLPSDSRHFL
jgi:hypothetical protein